MAGIRHGLVSPTFGRWLVNTRTALKFTQADVTARLRDQGVVCQTSRLSKYEKGRVPSAEFLWALTRVFNVSGDGLLATIAGDLGLIATDELGPSSARPHAPEGHAGGFMPLLESVDPERRDDFLVELGQLMRRYRRPPFQKRKRRTG